ncbi:MAG: sodium/solute symporter [Pseudomonadales bacterium]|nr:sodium:solute symporter family protein [Pseudomonadales bacterium]NIX08012.1 sodium/solute symporter [Pseudomonadales bacterium]
MAWIADHWVAALLFAVYTGLLFYNANVGRRRSHDLTDYYVGGRGMGGVAVGISFFATFASTNSYIGHAGKGYEYGLPWLTFAVMILIFAFLSWTSVAPRLRRFALHWDAITLPDYLARRYGAENPVLRVAAAVVILVSSLLYLVAIFKGGGHLFQQFLGIPYEGAVGLTLVIVMLYTSIGGFVSVVRTDVIQGILMIVGSGTIFYFVTRAAGGVDVLGQLAEQPESQHVFSWSGGIPFAVLLGISLSGSLKLIVDPRQVSRFFALKDQRSVRVGTWVALGGLSVIMLCLFPVGFYAHFLLDGVQDTDVIVPMLVSDPNVFPPWIADFLIVAMMAAAMSSMDSVLLVSASVLYKDVVEVVHPAAHPLTWTRIGVVGLALLAAGVALRPPGGIVEITIFSGSLYAVCFFPAILFGLHWRRGSPQAVLASIVSGLLVLVGWLLVGGREFVHEVFPAMLVSCLSYVWVANVTRPALERWPLEH